LEKFSINAGYLKGRKIEGVSDPRTRYTPSKVKSSIFSIINSNLDINECSFLELCAASGQVGMEAISRGASTSTFVDISGVAIKTLKKNILALDISEKVRIMKQDVLRYLKKQQETFDIVFVDPPFVEAIYIEIVKNILSKSDIIAKNGIIIVETQKNFPKIESEIYILKSSHAYNTIRIDLYKHKEL
jgi:16S rRNA (guanine(966)-N(2))-methyltransferase RsmD